MSLIMRWSLAPAVLVGWLMATASASAALTPEIRDGAEFFTPESVKKADAEIKDIKRNFKKDLLIETYNTVAADKAEEVKKMDRKARNRFFQDWARNRAKAVEVNGIYVLICKDPGHIQVEVGNETQRKAFTVNDRDKLRNILLTRLQEGAKVKEEAEKKKLHDKGLVEAVEFVRKTMSENLGKASTPLAGAPGKGAHAE